MRLAGLRLIPCAADGRPQEPEITLPDTVAGYAAACAELYARVGFEPPWVSYLVAAATSDGDAIVGGAAFVGPVTGGCVEIAYYTLPEHEGRGVATFAAAALVAIAQASPERPVITAKTLPETNASTRILTRLGFVRAGVVQDDDIGDAWLWRREGRLA